MLKVQRSPAGERDAQKWQQPQPQPQQQSQQQQRTSQSSTGTPGLNQSDGGSIEALLLAMEDSEAVREAVLLSRLTNEG